jgi:glycopeptide antibiotics resistance protein
MRPIALGRGVHDEASDRGFVLDPGLSAFAGLLLSYVAALATLATLSPFDFVATPTHGYSLWLSRSDVALNLALLFPAGFLLRLARTGRGGLACLDALGLGLAFSLLLESLQTFLPSRVSSPVDVLTNGLGAWAGALTHARLRPWLDRRLQKQLSLHLPLANILYLSVPLCSLDALALESWQQALGVLPLVAFMAWIAAGLYEHRLLAGQPPFAFRYALAIAALFAIGYLPLAVSSPLLYAALSCSMVCLTRLTIAVAARVPKTERRFVLATIRGALPWFLVYLLMLSVRTRLAQAAGFPRDGSQAQAFLLLRDVAAFTLFGYLVSELHARSVLSTARVLARAICAAVLIGSACVALRNEPGALIQSFQSVAVSAIAALTGALIHRAQLRLVRSWGHSWRPPRPTAVG